MPRRKDISSDLIEATVAAHLTEKGHEAISKLFGVHRSTERKIIHKWKTFKTADKSSQELMSQQVSFNVRFASAPREVCEECKSYISDAAGVRLQGKW